MLPTIVFPTSDDSAIHAPTQLDTAPYHDLGDVAPGGRESFCLDPGTEICWRSRLYARSPQTHQQLQLHRKFNLWAFPDQNGKPYNRLRLALDVDGGQLRLF
jgi:hypothetical protein